MELNQIINQIHCADCLDFMRGMEDNCVDLVLTDPPYGTTACKWDVVIPLEPMWEQLKRIIKPNGAIVMTATEPFKSVLVCSNLKMFRYDLVWDKIKGTGFLNAKKMPMRNHELIVVFYNKLPTFNPQMTHGHTRKVSFRAKHLQTEVYGDMNNDYSYDSTSRYPRSILVVSSDTQNSSVHPTQKPVALMTDLIKTYTNEGETVLDFTCGAGTTAVACINTNRNYIGIEISPEYCEIARKRVQEAKDSMGLFK